jgi:hypothetical protein
VREERGEKRREEMEGKEEVGRKRESLDRKWKGFDAAAKLLRDDFRAGGNGMSISHTHPILCRTTESNC